MKYFEFTAYLEPCYAGFLKSYNLRSELRGFALIGMLARPGAIYGLFDVCHYTSNLI